MNEQISDTSSELADLTLIDEPQLLHKYTAHNLSLLFEIFCSSREVFCEAIAFSLSLNEADGSIPQATERGSYLAGSLDFLRTVFTEVFEVIGVTDITFIHAENFSEGAEVSQNSLAAAREAVQQFIGKLASSLNISSSIL